MKFAPSDFFSLVAKLSKVCQIHTFAVIFVIAVVDCLDLNSFSYIHLSCLQSNKLIIFKNEITISST